MDLYSKIKTAINHEKVVFSVHADNRLRERRLIRWQIVEGFGNGELIRAHSSSRPNPKVLIRQLLADGTEIIAVWSYLKSIGYAKLVTVYFEE